MSTILDDIVKKRKQAISQLKQILPADAWEMMPLFQKKCRSLKKNLLKHDSTGIIAEFKRASPSKGAINEDADVFDVVLDYSLHGAAGVSVLTEPVFFKGNNDDISGIASSVEVPILRKDFIIDRYQIAESKAIGADIILLIAACLTSKQVKEFAAVAKNAGLEVLLEIHNEEEIGHICDDVDMIGINNRDLKTFKVDINTSLQLINKIPTSKPAIAESGISDAETIVTLRQAGFKGFLIGETFMNKPDPGKAFADFVFGLKPNQ